MRRAGIHERRALGGSSLLPLGAPGAPASVTTPLTVYGADLYQWHNGANVTLNASAVSALPDLSGKANDSLQGTAIQQPAYTATDATLDNQPTVAGDGSNDVLTCAGLTVDLATEDFYVCGIIKQITWTSGDVVSGGSGSTIPSLAQSGVSPQMKETATSAVNTNGAGTLGSWFRVEALWSVTPGASYLKVGATTVQTGNPGTGTRTASSLFAATASAFVNDAMAEFFVVKRASGSGGPTGPERATMNAALLAKYPSASF